MRQMVAAWLSTTALGMACLPGALAADMPVKAPVSPISPLFSWTGFYLGANVGGGWGNRSVNYSPNDAASVTLFAPGVASGAPPSTAFKSSGALGGVQLGYNWQLNTNWLVGAETDFNWSDMKGSGSSSPNLLSPSITATANEQIKWFGTVRARLGYLPTNKLLTYVTGGFAYGRVEHTASYSNNSAIPFGILAGGFSFTCNTAATCFTGTSNNTATGWTAGTGFEYALLKNLSLKAEYMYVNLGSNSVTETAVVRNAIAAPGSPLASFNAGYSHTSFNVARIGLNYHF